MSYFLDSLKAKRNKLSTSSSINKLLAVKPPKFMVYKDSLGNMSLLSIDSCKVLLTYSSNISISNEFTRQDSLEINQGVTSVFDEEVFNKLMEATIGKGNNYLYYEYDKPMQSRKIPFRKKKEDVTCTNQKTTEVQFL